MNPPSTLAQAAHPVVQEMLERRADLAAGRDLARRGTKLAIVAQGGAMRGVISGSALVGLERGGFTHVFDEAWGESAGAINLSFFLAGRAEFGCRIYLNDVSSLRFIHPLRLSKVLDLDYLIDEVMVRVTPLPVDDVLASRTRLLVSTTCFHDASPAIHDVRESPHPLMEVLRATAAAVPLAPRATSLDGVLHVDGGIADPMPVRRAIEAGATHVLVLPTVGVDGRAAPWTSTRRALVAPFVRDWPDAMRRALFHERPARYNAALDLTYGRQPAPAGVHVAALPPPANAPRVTRLTIRASRLRAAAAACIEQVESIWGPRPAQPTPHPAQVTVTP